RRRLRGFQVQVCGRTAHGACLQRWHRFHLEVEERKSRADAMTTLDLQPLTVTVPLWEEPPGVVRVGNSRVLLELVLRAFQRGDTPEAIVRSYPTLELADVYAVISRYLASPDRFNAYLRESDERAEAVRRQIEARQPPGPTREDLLTRARAKGLIS
ncbi:MAG: DUF433 domain-containing protein, partial [Patescibacteria group bacterium]|nr:DUF433 domain-containing protein [Patescibacteria group bacterium]